MYCGWPLHESLVQHPFPHQGLSLPKPLLSIGLGTADSGTIPATPPEEKAGRTKGHADYTS